MPDQLTLPFTIDATDLTEFLERTIAIEDEMDRLREDMRQHKEQYADMLPLRAVLTALKVVRARRKLAAHTKEPFPLEHQDAMQGLVEAHYAAQADALQRLSDEAAELE